MTVKTQGGKVITKDGKVSCSCCDVGCSCPGGLADSYLVEILSDGFSPYGSVVVNRVSDCLWQSGYRCEDHYGETGFSNGQITADLFCFYGIWTVLTVITNLGPPSEDPTPPISEWVVVGCIFSPYNGEHFKFEGAQNNPIGNYKPDITFEGPSVIVSAIP